MDEPITIVIVLFLVVIVAGIIILFSKQLLNNAQQNLNQLGPQNATKDQIVQLDTVHATDIINLANECIRENYKVTFEKKLCFVVTGKNFPDAYGGQALDENFTTDASGVGANYNALILTFDPEEKVLITT